MLLGRLTSMLDAQQKAYFLTCTAQSWLAVRLELIGTLVITFACLSAIVEHVVAGPNVAFAGLAGLSISYALSVTQSLNWSVRMASDMEAGMVSVERVQEYTKLENEAARKTELDDKLAGSWPSFGEIEFRGSKLRYRPDLPLVLKGLSLRIPGGSKVVRLSSVQLLEEAFDGLTVLLSFPCGQPTISKGSRRQDGCRKEYFDD
jgi:ATP-binding cassette, subfamily C (CFTR/MRP), member 1